LIDSGEEWTPNKTSFVMSLQASSEPITTSGLRYEVAGVSITAPPVLAYTGSSTRLAVVGIVFVVLGAVFMRLGRLDTP
jgi:hypothetical protein